jgi:hypothetical protein
MDAMFDGGSGGSWPLVSPVDVRSDKRAGKSR